MARGFIKAGGGSALRATLVEYGISLSGFDYVETRWSSLLTAVVYVMEFQTDFELKSADGSSCLRGRGTRARRSLWIPRKLLEAQRNGSTGTCSSRLWRT